MGVAGGGVNEHQAPTSGAPLSTSPKKLCASLFIKMASIKNDTVATEFNVMFV